MVRSGEAQGGFAQQCEMAQRGRPLANPCPMSAVPPPPNLTLS